MRAVVVTLAAAVLVAGCSGDKKPAAAPATEASAEKVKQDCADEKWKAQNLGLWYSLCRQPLRW